MRGLRYTSPPNLVSKNAGKERITKFENSVVKFTNNTGVIEIFRKIELSNAKFVQ